MHETGTGQQVAQLHERLMIMMMMMMMMMTFFTVKSLVASSSCMTIHFTTIYHNARSKEVLKHPAQNLELSPSDFRVFQPSEENVNFIPDDNEQNSVVQRFRQQPKEFFADKIHTPTCGPKVRLFKQF